MEELNLTKNKADEANRGANGKEVLNFLTEQLGLTSQTYLLLFLTVMFYFGQSFTIQSNAFLSEILSEEWHLNKVKKSSISSSLFMGILIGSFCSGFVSDNFGRKFNVLFGAFIAGLSSILIVYVDRFSSFAFLNTATGFGLAFLMNGLLTLLSEITSSTTKSFIYIFNLILVPFGGIMSAYTAEFTKLQLRGHWKLICAYRILSFLLIYCLGYLLKESPKFTITVNKSYNEGFKRLESLLDANRGLLTTERKRAMVEFYNLDFKPKLKLVELLSNNFLWKTILISCSYFCFNFVHFGIIYIFPYLLKEEEFKYELHKGSTRYSSNSRFKEVANEIIFSSLFDYPTMLIIPFILNSKTFGRIKTMIGFVGLAFVSSGIALLFPSKILIFLSFSKAFILTLGPVIAIVIFENYPTILRGSAHGIVTSIGRLGALLSQLILEEATKISWNFPTAALGFAILLAFILLVCLENLLENK